MDRMKSLSLPRPEEAEQVPVVGALAVEPA